MRMENNLFLLRSGIICNLPGENAGQIFVLYFFISSFVFVFFSFRQITNIYQTAAHFLCVISAEDSIAMQVGKQFKETDSRDYGEFNVKIW